MRGGRARATVTRKAYLTKTDIVHGEPQISLVRRDVIIVQLLSVKRATCNIIRGARRAAVVIIMRGRMPARRMNSEFVYPEHAESH